MEARLLGDDRIPPLHETLEELRASGLVWLAAYEPAEDRAAGHLVGAVAWEDTIEVVDIDRLVVDPAAHRRGIGRALVQGVLGSTSAPRVIVSTGRANRPARALYEQLGMTHVDDDEVVPGLWVSCYELRR